VGDLSLLDAGTITPFFWCRAHDRRAVEPLLDVHDPSELGLCQGPLRVVGPPRRRASASDLWLLVGLRSLALQALSLLSHAPLLLAPHRYDIFLVDSLFDFQTLRERGTLLLTRVVSMCAASVRDGYGLIRRRESRGPHRDFHRLAHQAILSVRRDRQTGAQPLPPIPEARAGALP
jgi:hypothetical protein